MELNLSNGKVIKNNRTEFMPILNDKLEKEVVAFLNSATGGEICIGVSYEGGVLGVDGYANILPQIANRIRVNISPNCMGLFDVFDQEVNGKHIIRVIVSRGTEKPYYITLYGMNSSGCYVRSDGDVKQMDIETVKALKDRPAGVSLGMVVSPGTSQHTFAQLRIYYEERGLGTDDRLLGNLGFYTQDKKFNYIAYMFSDSNGLFVKFNRHSITGEVIESEEYGSCSLPKTVYRVLDKLEVENRTFTESTKDGKINLSRMFDKEAVKEAFVNAVIHNDYTHGVMPSVDIFPDRITVISNGKLPEDISEDEFFSGIPVIRNKEIYRIFKDLKITGHMGSGITEILKNHDRSIYTFTENSIRVTIPFVKKDDNKKMYQAVHTRVSNKTRDAIIDMIKKDGNVTAGSLAAYCGVSKKAIEWHLKKLREKKVIFHEGSRKTGCWKIRV